MDFLNSLLSLDLDCYIVENDADKRYLTNFSGTTCEVVVSVDGVYLITDGRYESQCKLELYDNINLIITTPQLSYHQALIKLVSQYKKVGIDENTSIKRYEKLEHDLGQTIKLVPSFLAQLRQVKTNEEIAKIKNAINISEQAFLNTLPYIKPGVSEREIKARLEAEQVICGADDYSFPSIVASGENSCKPHARFSDRIIQDGDILTIDFGCFYQGYCSDMTRTFFVGTPKDENLVKICDLVAECAKQQINAVKPGIKTSSIDAIAHNLFSQYGVDEAFKHGTGHGIGLEIHEMPFVNRVDDTILEPGMIITIEPGLYFENYGGCRIEQDVLVTDDGCEVLTNLSNSYNILNDMKG